MAVHEMGAALIAAVVVALGMAWFVYWLVAALSGRQHALHHLQRLAAEIVAVAQTIESDLAGRPPQETAVFFSQCRQQRRRADEALGIRNELDRLSLPEMQAWLEQLHEDHRYIVDLRSALDAELAGLERVRSSRSRPRERTVLRSSWPTSGYRQSGLT